MITTDEKITGLLTELNRLPDMMGLFIHTDQNGITFPDLPGWCPVEEMERTGLLLHELFNKKGIFNRRGKNILITFDSLLIIGIQLDNDATLVCLCTSNIDTVFFETTSKDIIQKLKEEIEHIPQTKAKEHKSAEIDIILETVAGKKEMEALNENGLGDISVDPLLFKTASDNLGLPPAASHPPKYFKGIEPADLSVKMLLPIERALTAVIGPASEIILADALHTWKQTGEPTFDRVNELINLLCSKIENSRQEGKFRDMLQRQKVFKKSIPLDTKKVEKAFARIIGPASSIVMKEILKKWQPDKKSSNTDQLDELVDLLCIEIDDPKREEKLRAFIATDQLS